MTDQSGIRAGQAFVVLRPQLGDFPGAFNKVLSQGTQFAGKVNQLGERMKGNFGSKIFGGLATIAAAGAVDTALRSIADKMRERLATGERLAFHDVGEEIAKAIEEGIRTAPVIGPLADILGLSAFDPLWGSPMAQQAVQDRSRVMAGRNESTTASVMRQLEELRSQAQTFGNPSAERRRALEQSLNEAINSLVRNGWSLDGARQFVAPVLEEFRKLESLQVDETIAEARRGFASIAGTLDANAVEAERFEEQLKRIAQSLREAGRESDIGPVTQQLRADFDAARQLRSEGQSAAGLRDLFKDLQRNADGRRFGQGELLRQRVLELGGSGADVARALELFRIANQQFSTVGTFSSAAFGASPAASNQRAVAESSKDTAKNTRRIAQLLERGRPLVFGA